jgi:hypothetical protein
MGSPLLMGIIMTDDLMDRIEALTSENERLREALEPLANKGRLYLDALDVEKARAALEKQP